MTFAPLDQTTTMPLLVEDPYPIYKRMRVETPIVRVAAAGRTFLTKAKDTDFVKKHPGIFSSVDKETPMARAFQSHTLMRKDGAEHRKERMAMMKSLSPKTIRNHWEQIYTEIADAYMDQLPKDATVDLFTDICGPVAAKILAHVLGIPSASDKEMIQWSQALIDGAGNYQNDTRIFERSDQANIELDALFAKVIDNHKSTPNASAFSEMVTAKDPIAMSQVYANLKIAIGGGINEPRDALSTAIYGLLTNPEQLEEVRRTDTWSQAFEEAIRWVAPIQFSTRIVTEDVELRGITIPKGETIMAVQASSNRDEDLHENGENFDVFRAKKPHQAFGGGPHFCAGADISRRLVGGVMLPRLFERFPKMKLTDPKDVQWRGFAFRGPLNLPVTLS